MIHKINGLKFPDEYIIKFFFNEKLEKKKGKVLELGCGNGNNLSLFSSYNWKTLGVDNSKMNIKNATKNFNLCSSKNKNFTFLCSDMLKYLLSIKKIDSDVVILCNSIYYQHYDDIISTLNLLKLKTKKSTLFFFRVRLNNDSRKMLSKKIYNNTYKLKKNLTNEKGAIITLFEPKKFLNILQNIFKPSKISYLKNGGENFLKKKIVFNSDLILWFKS